MAKRNRARRRSRRPAGANAIVRPTPGRDGRRDSDVPNVIARSLAVIRRKRSSAAASLSPVRPPPYLCEAHNRAVAAADPILFVDVELGTCGPDASREGRAGINRVVASRAGLFRQREPSVD